MDSVYNLGRYLPNNIKRILPSLQGEAHKVYRATALKLLIISKNVSDKSFSVRECRHTRPPYFLPVMSLKLRQGQHHFLKWNHVLFFDEIITDFKRNSATFNTRSF